MSYSFTTGMKNIHW